MPEVGKKVVFELRVTLGNVISIVVILSAIIFFWARLEGRQITIETTQVNQKQALKDHEDYDNRRFDAYATKETRSMRDIEVDRRFNDLEKQLDILGKKLDDVISIHMKR